MAAFAERLRNFDQEIAKGNATDVGLYAPTRFRASLLEGGPGGDGVPRPWPWPTFGPDAFTVVDESTGFGFPSKVLSGIEMSLLGLDESRGRRVGDLGRRPERHGLRPGPPPAAAGRAALTAPAIARPRRSAYGAAPL